MRKPLVAKLSDIVLGASFTLLGATGAVAADIPDMDLAVAGNPPLAG